MSDDPKQAKPDPIEDVRKGLGLLFRAAKGAIESLPTGKFEEAVLTGAREVGRAIENVTSTLDKQVFKRERPPDASAKPAEPAGDDKDGATGKDGGRAPPPAAPDEPKGPRVG